MNGNLANGNPVSLLTNFYKYKAQQNYHRIPIFGATVVFEEKYEDNSNHKSDKKLLTKEAIFGRYCDTSNTKLAAYNNLNPVITKDKALEIAIQSFIPNHTKLIYLIIIIKFN